MLRYAARFQNGRSYWSSEYRATLDLEEGAEPTAAEAYARVLAEDLTRVRNIHLQAIRSGRSYELQFRVRWRDGSVHHVIERGRASYAADGSLLTMAAAAARRNRTSRYDGEISGARLCRAASELAPLSC